MRQEHPNQLDLTGLPPGGPAPEVAESAASEVIDLARLSAEVLEKGLVRESRPVFVFDKNEAKKRSGNAERQARFREKLEQKGLKNAAVPVAVLAQVEAAGGWEKFTVPEPQIVEKIVEKVVDRPVEKLVEVPRVVEVPKIVEVERVLEVPKIVHVEVPRPAEFTEAQMVQMRIGRRVQALTGWRRRLASFLLNNSGGPA